MPSHACVCAPADHLSRFTAARGYVAVFPLTIFTFRFHFLANWFIDLGDRQPRKIILVLVLVICTLPVPTGVLATPLSLFALPVAPWRVHLRRQLRTKTLLAGAECDAVYAHCAWGGLVSSPSGSSCNLQLQLQLQLLLLLLPLQFVKLTKTAR